MLRLARTGLSMTAAAVLLVACTGGPPRAATATPTRTPAAVSTPTATATPTPSATATATAAVTRTSTPAATVTPQVPTATTVATTAPTPVATTATPPAPAAVAVDIQGFSFSPAATSIARGATVTWTNRDQVQHDVTLNGAGEFHSPALNEGQSYSRTFDQPGTYAYLCSIHPFMGGTVVVR